jgi:hypothetical protein
LAIFVGCDHEMMMSISGLLTEKVIGVAKAPGHFIWPILLENI